MDEVEWIRRRFKFEDLRVGFISWVGFYFIYEIYKSIVVVIVKGLGRR